MKRVRELMEARWAEFEGEQTAGWGVPRFVDAEDRLPCFATRSTQ